MGQGGVKPETVVRPIKSKTKYWAGPGQTRIRNSLTSHNWFDNGEP